MGKAGFAHGIGYSSLLLGYHSHMAMGGEHVLVQTKKFAQQTLDSIAHYSLAHLARNSHAYTGNGLFFDIGQYETQKMWTVKAPSPGVTGRVFSPFPQTVLH